MRHEHVPLHKIVLPARLHRVDIDEEAIRDLAGSIAKDGLINAIAVTDLGEVFRLEAGHRRFLAHQRLQRPTIEARVYEAGDNASGESIRFAENLHRQDLSPMEEATAIDGAMREGDMTLEQLARMLQRSQAWVGQRLELLTLPQDLADYVHQKRLAMAAALELNQVEDVNHRTYLLRYTLDAGASIAVVREWVNQWRLAAAQGNAAGAARPVMPVDGQPIVIQIPCYVCHEPLPHDRLRILRICPECTHQLAGSGVAAHHEPPSPTPVPTHP